MSYTLMTSLLVAMAVAVVYSQDASADVPVVPPGEGETVDARHHYHHRPYGSYYNNYGGYGGYNSGYGYNNYGYSSYPSYGGYYGGLGWREGQKPTDGETPAAPVQDQVQHTVVRRQTADVPAPSEGETVDARHHYHNRPYGSYYNNYGGYGGYNSGYGYNNYGYSSYPSYGGYYGGLGWREGQKPTDGETPAAPAVQEEVHTVVRRETADVPAPTEGETVDARHHYHRRPYGSHYNNYGGYGGYNNAYGYNNYGYGSYPSYGSYGGLGWREGQKPAEGENPAGPVPAAASVDAAAPAADGKVTFQ